MAFGLSASAIGSIAGPLIGGLMGGSSGSGGQQTSTQQQQLDPRAQNIIYGNQGTLKPGAQPKGTDASGNPIYADSDYEGRNLGLLPRAQAMLDDPQKAGMQLAGQAYDNYVGKFTPYDLEQQRQTASALATSGGVAHQMQAAQGGYTSPFNVAQSAFPSGVDMGPQTARANTASASLINGPSQNNLNLNPVYSDFLGGELGNNPYLAGSIQKGLNQSANQFNQLQNSMTKNFKESILPSLRSEAIANGGYGGSRQGIAEGKAADAFATQLAQALSQVGQNNTDSAVSAQAGAYNQDRANQLNALSNLSGNQYNVAGQNAGIQNQNSLANAQMLNSMGQFNAGVGNNYNSQLLSQMLNNNQFNTSAQNAANAMQYGGNQQMNMQNLANKQNAGQFNASALLGMDQLNSQNKATGAGLLGQLTNNNFNMASQNNDYKLNQAGKVNSLMAPYLGMGQTTTSSQPLYQNQGANVLGGALAGANLFKSFGNTGISGQGQFLSNNQNVMNSQGLTPNDLYNW